ncbi:MAG: hypothetical protein LBT40_13710 [Deltaproteobacteria bacterium]|nr:hypothetical protein [Deltaproteobacteria bacterium]
MLEISYFSQSLTGLSIMEIFLSCVATLKLNMKDPATWFEMAQDAASYLKPLLSLTGEHGKRMSNRCTPGRWTWSACR